MNTTPEPIDAAQALSLVRERWRETNHPVPGFAAPEDTIANSYHQDEHPSGWVFRPGVAGLDRDPGLASLYPYFVAHRSGTIGKSRYDRGADAAVALLDEMDQES